MLTAVSVASRLVYQASRHWRHLSVSGVTTPIIRGNTISKCVSKQYYRQLCAPEVLERVSGLREGVWSVSEIRWTDVVLHVTENILKALNKTDKTLIQKDLH